MSNMQPASQSASQHGVVKRGEEGEVEEEEVEQRRRRRRRRRRSPRRRRAPVGLVLYTRHTHLRVDAHH